MLGHKSICFGGFPRMARLMPAAWLVFLSFVRAGYDVLLQNWIYGPISNLKKMALSIVCFWIYL